MKVKLDSEQEVWEFFDEMVELKRKARKKNKYHIIWACTHLGIAAINLFLLNGGLHNRIIAFILAFNAGVQAGQIKIINNG